MSLLARSCGRDARLERGGLGGGRGRLLLRDQRGDVPLDLRQGRLLIGERGLRALPRRLRRRPGGLGLRLRRLQRASCAHNTLSDWSRRSMAPDTLPLATCWYSWVAAERSPSG